MSPFPFRHLAASAVAVASIALPVRAQDASPATQPATPVAAHDEFERSLRTARPGDLVQTPFLDTRALAPIPLSIAAAPGAPQYLLSDKPEYFRAGDGIAMQEEVRPGVVRLYLYHVPEPTGAPKTISAVIENLGPGPMRMRFLRYASPDPSGDYHKLARQAMVTYLSGANPPAELDRTLGPGERSVIDPSIDRRAVTKDILVHVLHEFEIDQPARITVFQRDPNVNSLKVIDGLPKLPRVLPGWHASGAGRGLFLTSDFDVTTKEDRPFDTTAGAAMVLVADGKDDSWIEGRDTLDPSSPAQNKGNYGVMYRVRIPYTTPDGRGVAVLMCGHRPDNKWCRYTSAAVKVNDGVHPGGVVALPSGANRFDSLPQAAVMQVYPAVPEGQTGTIEFTYSPPGACCLPTPILLIPYPN
jgi:hypothetical protein